MPSFSHELLVDLFRHRGELAPALLRAAAGIKVDHRRAEPSSIDLSQVASTEFRADSVVVLRDGKDAAVGAQIVEVQLGIDPAKRRSWPVYVTTLHAEHGCAVVLIVLAPDPAVARWARTPIPLGHPGFCLTPVVIGFDEIPRIVEPAAATKLPELAVLSTMAHRDLAVASAAIAGLAALPADRTKVYFDVIMSVVAPRDRKILEARMQGYVYQSEFARKYYSQGLEEGLEKGLEQGLALARAAVLTLVRAKLDVLSAHEEAAISAVCTERAATELIGALGRAETAAEVHAILAALRAGPLPSATRRSTRSPRTKRRR